MVIIKNTLLMKSLRLPHTSKEEIRMIIDGDVTSHNKIDNPQFDSQ